MSRKERVQLIERTSSMSSNIMCTNNENMLPPKFPALKSKGRALANAINRDLNRTSIGKAALERQRENASKLASGRSVVDKADKENQVLRNKLEVRSKHQFSTFHAPLQPQIKTNKLKNILEERQNKFVKSESVISLYTKQEIKKIEKEVKTKAVIVQKINEEPKPVVVSKQPKPEVLNEEPKSNVVNEHPVPELEKIPPGVVLIDKEEEHANNEFLLGIYADEIHGFLKNIEASQPIKKEYLTPSHIMTQHMRSLLVDWLFEVQQLFKLLNETIHLAIALLDRFMQDHPSITKNELQLVGVSCIFLASKYEEMYPPDLDDLVDISAKTYTKTQIIKMEQLIFSALDYQMGRPSPAQFLRRYGRAGKVDIVTYCLAKYFVDLCLVSYCLCHVPPSLMAASALYFSLESRSSELFRRQNYIVICILFTRMTGAHPTTTLPAKTASGREVLDRLMNRRILRLPRIAALCILQANALVFGLQTGTIFNFLRKVAFILIRQPMMNRLKNNELLLLSEDSESEVWTPTLIYYSGYKEDQMIPVIRKLALVVWNAPSSKYQAVKNKYLDPKKTHCVSALQELRSEKVYKLAHEV